jgi:hypothetical protein
MVKGWQKDQEASREILLNKKSAFKGNKLS